MTLRIGQRRQDLCLAGRSWTAWPSMLKRAYNCFIEVDPVSRSCSLVGILLALAGTVPNPHMEAMGRRSKLAIHAAVMSCLARCAESDAPIASLGDFLDELSKLGWQTDEI